MRTTGCTLEFYAHNMIHSQVFSYYSQVQNCMTGVTREHFQLVSNFCVQCASYVARAQHTGCLQNFLRHDVLLKLFCKLGHELYYTMLNYQTINIPTRRDNLDSPLKLSYPVGSVYRVHMIHNAEFKIRKSRY